MAVALDTLQIARDLRAASFSDVQAEGIAHALRAAQDAGFAEVATKKEMLHLASELRVEMAELRGDLRREMAELRAELRADMAELRAELRLEMAGLRRDLTELRGEMRREIVASRNIMLMWLVPVVIGQAGVFAVVMRLLGTP